MKTDTLRKNETRRPAAQRNWASEPTTKWTPVAQKIGLKTLLVPMDFSENSIKALRYAAAFAERFGGTLHLEHVLEPPPIFAGLETSPLALSEEALKGSAEARLALLARDEVDELIPASPHVLVGKPYEQILALAKTLEADLIIMGTHGYTGFKHAFLGSTTEKVVRYAPCPVLVVRETQHDFIY